MAITTAVEIWDSIVASAQQTSNSRQSRPRRSAQVPLPLSKEIVPRNPAKAKAFPWPGYDRFIDEIDQMSRASIRGCVSGETPWPLVLLGSAGVGKSCAALCLADRCAGAEYFTLPFLCRLLNEAGIRGIFWS